MNIITNGFIMGTLFVIFFSLLRFFFVRKVLCRLKKQYSNESFLFVAEISYIFTVFLAFIIGSFFADIVNRYFTFYPKASFISFISSQFLIIILLLTSTLTLFILVGYTAIITDKRIILTFPTKLRKISNMLTKEINILFEDITSIQPIQYFFFKGIYIKTNNQTYYLGSFRNINKGILCIKNILENVKGLN